MSRRLLFYTHASDGGGAEITLRRLAEGFAAAGDEVVLATDHAGRAPAAPLSGSTMVTLGPGHLRATLRLARLLRRERPDASLSALGAQNLKHLAAALLAGRRRRCILGVHGFAEAEPRRLARSFYRLAPIATHLAAATVCVSDALAADMARRWGARRLVRIYNPVPLPCPTASRRSQPPLVLALGRLERIKRFPDLVAALALLPSETRLAILGEGPERGAIEAAAIWLGVRDRLDLPGHVADPSGWYARAACVAIASASESFGLTAAEALAHGVPVVTTDCGGPAEVLAGCGRVVPVGDVGALAAAIRIVLAEPGDPAPRLRRAEAFSLKCAVAAYAALADRVAANA